MSDIAQSKTILLVEDDTVVALSEAAILEHYGYIVKTAHSGEEALRFFREGKPADLVLMDIDLGDGMDGAEAAKEILKTNNIPIVFLSSHTEKEIVDRTEKITSYGYVVKESGNVVLAASIKMAFRLFEAHRKLLNELGERKKTEEALQRSLNDHRRSQSVARIGNWVLDLGTNTFTASDEGLRLFGFPPNATPVFDEVVALIDPADRPRLKSVFTEFLQTGSPYQVEMKISMKDTGAVRYIFSIGEIEYDSGGKPSKVVGINLDITERIRVENALRESEEKYRTLVENINDIIFTLDTEGVITFISSRIYQLSGYSPHELIGRIFTDFIHPDDLPGLVESYQETIQGKLAPYEYRVLHRDGSVRFVRTFSRVVSAGGKPEYLTGIMTDVTERMRVDEAIKISEQKYNAFINSSVDMVFLKDEKFRYTMVNSNLADFFEKESEHVIGLTDYDLMPEEAADMCHKSDLETLEYCRTVVNEEVVGGCIFETRKFPVTIGHTTVVGGYIRDVTERKNSELKLALALDEKQALLRELQHRIKNTLAMITSLASLEAGASSNSAVKAALESITGRIGTLSTLYSILYSSGDVKELRLDKYLHSIVDSIMTAFRPVGRIIHIQLALQEIRIETKIATSLGLILNELLTNSLKYAFPGDRGGNVHVELAMKDRGIELTVSDDGVGLPGDFDLRTSGGFGLRLAGMLVKQRNGRIEYECDTRTVFRAWMSL